MLYGGPDYFTHANDTILKLAMIETLAGMKNLDSILKVDGLDGVFIGPGDLSLALGLPPSPHYTDGPLKLALAKIFKAARKHKKMVGIFCTSLDFSEEMKRLGYDFIVLANDAYLLRNITTHWAKAIRAAYASSRENLPRFILRNWVKYSFQPALTTMPLAPTKLARSFLFVPGDRPERFVKAIGSGADAVILDLEDAVGASAKPAARQAVLDYVSQNYSTGLWIRINAVGTAAHADDLALLKELSKRLSPYATEASAKSTAQTSIQIMLPKVESRALTDKMVDDVSHPEGVKIIAQIESALGLDQARDFAQSPHITRLAFGSIDYSLDLGLSAEDDNALMHARSHIVWVSRLTGLPAPIDTVTVDLKNSALIEHDAKLAKHMGFGGKLCIHPSQVAPVNQAFSPSAKEIAWAEQVIEASAAAGDGAVNMGGQMIDRPVLLRAQRILDLAS